jgi:hypothetical protein
MAVSQNGGKSCPLTGRLVACKANQLPLPIGGAIRFVPAMFALMDDASRVSWRLGQRVIGFRAEEDTAPGHPAEPAARH